MKLRKILSVLLSFVLIVGCLPMAMASSTGTLKVVADVTCANVGDEVDFTIYLSDADKTDGIKNFNFDLVLSAGLEYVSYAIAAEAEGVFNGIGFNEDILRCGCTGTVVRDPYVGGSLALLTVTCKVVAAGEQTVTLSGCYMTDGNYKKLEPAVVEDSIVEHEGEWSVTKTADCTEPGEESYICAICGEVLETREIPQLEHEGEWSVTKKASCTEPGEESYICDTCKKVIDTRVIPAKGHKDENHDNICDVCGATLCTDGNHKEETIYGYPATCTEPGLTDGVKCSACGEILVAQEVIPAKGHSYDDGVVTTAPTCTDTGVKTYTCAVCGHSYTEVIPALGHNWQYDDVTGNLVCANCGEMMSVGEDADVIMDENGTIIMTVTLEDGTVVVVYKYTTGVQITVVTSPEGAVVSIVINIPSKISGEAVKNDEPVVLPMDEIVKKHGNIENIAVVIKTNCEELVPVAYAVDDVKPGHVIVIVNADGTQTVVADTKMTENSLVFYCENGIAVKVVYNAKNFTDIKAGKWYNNAVDFVSAREIMTGMTATTFEPNGTTTRAQVWTMLARLAGVDTTCIEGNWYDIARAWAMENGISDGTGANDSITREQLVTMLYRFAQFQGKADGEAKSIADFSDAAQVSSWAKVALEWAYGAGVMHGNADGTMNPKGNTTRAEMAQFFMNFIQNI